MKLDFYCGITFPVKDQKCVSTFLILWNYMHSANISRQKKEKKTLFMQTAHLESESEVAQSCLTLCDPMDCSLPGSPVHGIFRQQYWSGLPFPSPGDLPNPGIKPRSLAL